MTKDDLSRAGPAGSVDKPPADTVPPGADAPGAAQPASDTPRQGPYWPVWPTILAAVCLTLIAIAQFATPWLENLTPTWEGAVANIVTLILSFVIFVAYLTWFVFGSGFPWWARLAGVALLAGGLGYLGWKYEIKGVFGYMTVQLGERGAPARDATLPPLRPASGGVTLGESRSTDFPQFLGPRRDGRVDVALARDFETHPPREVWRRDIGAGWSSFAVVGEYAFTMEQRGPDEFVSCYALADGKPKWARAVQTRHETVLGGIGPRGTPTVHQGKVLALGATGVLRCLSAASGEPLWEQNLLTHSPAQDMVRVAWGRAASPLVVDKLVVVPVGGPPAGPHVTLAAYNLDNGQLAWQAGDQQVGYASPALLTLAGSPQIVMVNESTITGHSPDTGQELWRHPWKGASNGDANASQPNLLPGGLLLFNKGYGKGAELVRVEHPSGDAWGVKSVWANPRALKTKFTQAVVRGEHVYALSDGILECVNLADGERAWKGGRYGHGQILLAGDLLIVQAENGHVAFVDASPMAYNELASFPMLNDKTWNNPCLAGDLLLVRNATEAACYRLKLK